MLARSLSPRLYFLEGDRPDSPASDARPIKSQSLRGENRVDRSASEGRPISEREDNERVSDRHREVEYEIERSREGRRARGRRGVERPVGSEPELSSAEGRAAKQHRRALTDLLGHPPGLRGLDVQLRLNLRCLAISFCTRKPVFIYTRTGILLTFS